MENRQEGKQGGELKNGKFAAQKLIVRGFANADKAEITGLSIDLIEQLSKKMN